MELSEIPIDWLVEPAVVTRPPLRVVPGESFFVRLVALSEIPIDWLVQHPDPLLPLPRPPTVPVLVEFGVPIPPSIPDTDFIVQHPDPVRRPPAIVSEGSLVHRDEHEDLIPASDWLIQHPDPLPKPPPINTEPELAFEHEDLIPAPDWLVQPDPVRPPDRVVPGEQFLVEQFRPPDIDWLVQHPDPVAPEERRQGWYILGELVEIPIDTWLQPPSQPVLPRPPRQDWYARVDLEFVPEEVLLDKWWQPASEPVRLPIQLVRFHGELFLVEFAVPIIGVPFVFVFQECQALWEIIHPFEWESAVAPSGYRAPPKYVPAPSGYSKKADGTALWDL